MPEECYPSRAFCVIHDHSGITRINENASNNFSLVGIGVIQESRKRGAQLVAAGKVQMAMSVTSMPRRKIWVPYSKKQHRLQRSRGTAYKLQSEKVSSKKFDYRPGPYPAKGREAHFRRQPRSGIYSRTSQGSIRRHRKGQFVRGAGKVATGKVLPVLGIGLYSYDVIRADDPIKKIKKDIIRYGQAVVAGDISYMLFGIPGTPVEGMSYSSRVRKRTQLVRRQYEQGIQKGITRSR